MNSSILFFKIPFWILAVVIRISCTENFTKDDNSSYSSLYDDSVYIEYNDTFDPNPECSVVPACQHSSSPWGDESLEGDVVPLAPIGCQTYVNCYEYSTFPPEIPDQASILTIQGSFFKNLSRSNLEELSSLVELMVEYNELRHIEPETFRNQAKLEVKSQNFVYKLVHLILVITSQMAFLLIYYLPICYIFTMNWFDKSKKMTKSTSEKLKLLFLCFSDRKKSHYT